MSPRSSSPALHRQHVRQMPEYYSHYVLLTFFAVNGSLHTAARTPSLCSPQERFRAGSADHGFLVHFPTHNSTSTFLRRSDSHSSLLNLFRNLQLHVRVLPAASMISAFNSNAEWSFPIPILISVSPRIANVNVQNMICLLYTDVVFYIFIFTLSNCIIQKNPGTVSSRSYMLRYCLYDP